MKFIKDKRGIQMSFAWLFAIIVGAFVLFLAVFFAIRFVDIGDYQSNTETAKRIDVLLNPLQTSFEDGRVSKLSLPAETRIYNDCSLEGSFGLQSISISQKSFNKWPSPGARTNFENKYIFSSDIEEGKNFYVFSKSFDYPFKISGVIYLISTEEDYCFKNSPEEIRNELLGLKTGGSLNNIYLESCPDSSVNVCFDVEENCDVQVENTCDVNCENDYEKGIVKRRRESIKYDTEALMYAAIFSDKETYECQTKRLFKRAENLAKVYYDQSQ
ncbi:MAG: hypothetical protein AABY22_31105, partial [Nanoarchaeota archaeon]